MAIQKITSAANPRIKHLKKLIADKDYRYEHKEYVIEGIRVLDAVRDAREVYVLEGTQPPPVESGSIFSVESKVFNEVATTENSQGVIVVAALRMMDAAAIDKTARYVLLDRLQDPGNMGSIIRTACAFGMKGIIITPGCVDPFSPKVVRAAASCLEKMDIIKIDSMAQLAGYTLIGADMKGEDIASLRWPDAFILALGSEGHGLSPETREQAASMAAIPISSGIESLNAAVAAGIILYAASGGKRK